ncbi:MAG: 3D domain-containing protein [Phenylobacterium sp.]|uniref:3D domain-containing protein n=1 Tax=Phenylobacterium sp. TaxID=1871053 RepID=UPI0030194ECE
MRRRLAALAALTSLLAAIPAAADAQAAPDPLGDLLMGAMTGSIPGSPEMKLKATLYHIGARGVGTLDSLGCKVVAMRTAAIDTRVIPRRTVLFIQETVGLRMPDGRVHDGYWYASDTGGAIKGNRIDLFTGSGSSSMKPIMGLNLTLLTVSRVGQFKGCPPA